MATDRIEVARRVRAKPSRIFALLCDPQGHVAIDSSGMLQSASGEPVGAVGDTFVVHMDREALNDYPELGKYDVTVTIRTFEPDSEIAWHASGAFDLPHFYGYRIEPADDGGSIVTSYYDADVPQDRDDLIAAWRDANVFPVISEGALRATLGILARTVEHS